MPKEVFVKLKAENTNFDFNSSNLRSGVYFYRMFAGGLNQQSRLNSKTSQTTPTKGKIGNLMDYLFCLLYYS